MIRILIADDHAIVRAGLKQFIADQADMEVTAEASSGSEAIAAVRARDFDVVLLDIVRILPCELVRADEPIATARLPKPPMNVAVQLR